MGGSIARECARCTRKFTKTYQWRDLSPLCLGCWLAIVGDDLLRVTTPELKGASTPREIAILHQMVESAAEEIADVDVAADEDKPGSVVAMTCTDYDRKNPWADDASS